MALKSTTFKNGDWVVLNKDLEKYGVIDDCPKYCVTHTEKAEESEKGKEIVFAEEITLDFDEANSEGTKVFDFAENFTATGLRDQDMTMDRHMSMMSLVLGDLTDEERNEMEEQYRDYLDERKAFYEDELEFEPAGYSLA